MDRKMLEENICRRFCSYYNPAKDADLSCRGFLVVELLSADGHNLPFTAVGKSSGSGAEEALRLRLCGSCSFEEEDCDFAVGKEGAPPCGGFLFLSRIIEDGVIPVDVIPIRH